jgi:NAD(P)-dependent dehydrogenase (short-subunit alcohol dehydrogenase family)
MTSSLPWKTVWITGASTGIGREIALQLAAQGVTVAVSARGAEKLAALGPSVKAYPLDVTDRAAVMNAVEKIENELGTIDLALFAAGTYSPVDLDHFDPKLFDVALAANYMGVVNGLAGLLPAMLRRRAGHVAWIASVSGYTGLPKAAAYGPTKAALINLAESLKPELALRGVKVSVVNPGFVETPLTAQNDFEMPFLMKADEAARLTIAGLAKGRFEVAYPTMFVVILKIMRRLPYWLYFWIVTKSVLKA